MSCAIYHVNRDQPSSSCKKKTFIGAKDQTCSSLGLKVRAGHVDAGEVFMKELRASRELSKRARHILMISSELEAIAASDKNTAKNHLDYTRKPHMARPGFVQRSDNGDRGLF